MKNNFDKVIILLFLITTNVCCIGLQKKENKQNSNSKNEIKVSTNDVIQYESTIFKIETKARDIISWDELFQIREFVGLYENSKLYSDSAIHFLNKENHSILQMKICINSMQSLDIEDYIKLCDECRILFENNKLEEEILDWVINPNFSKRYLLLRNYREPLVIQYLEKVKSSSRVSESLKHKMDDILSGKTWNDLTNINNGGN